MLLMTVSSTTPPQQEASLDVSTIIAGGCCLLPLSILFTFINLYFIWVVYRNWERVKDSLYFHSYMILLVLTLADLAFALLVGIPTGIHLAFVKYLNKQPALIFFSKYILFFFFEYLFLLRVVIVAVLAADKCLHLTKPLRYTFLVSSKITVAVCITMVVVPVVIRVIPNIVYLTSSRATADSPGSVSMVCKHYVDRSVDEVERWYYTDNFTVPLTCDIDLTHTKGMDIDLMIKIDTALLFTVVLIGCLTIIICNITIIVYLIVNFAKIKPMVRRANTASDSWGNLLKASFLTFLLTVTFALTNFPYVVLRLQDYRARLLGEKGAKIDNTPWFICLMLVFLSLIFHPWCYFLKMRSLRSLVICNPCSSRARRPDSSTTRKTIHTSLNMYSLKRASDDNIPSARTQECLNC